MIRLAQGFARLGVVTAATATVFGTLTSSAAAFTFTTQYEGPAGKGDAFLRSVILEGGEVIDQFSFVESATIVQNDEYSGGNTGAASADRGDLATTGLAQEQVSAEQVAFNLGTHNLNNIIDTEDRGSFQIDLNFSRALDNLLIWERGMNSRLGVQALDAVGNLVGNYRVLDSRTWEYAGFDIDTTEIGSAQRVGSIGLSIAEDLGLDSPISSLRFFSESGFNGPDWKFVGTDATRDVPEPGLTLALVLAAATCARQRGRITR